MNYYKMHFLFIPRYKLFTKQHSDHKYLFNQSKKKKKNGKYFRSKHVHVQSTTNNC